MLYCTHAFSSERKIWNSSASRWTHEYKKWTFRTSKCILFLATCILDFHVLLSFGDKRSDITKMSSRVFQENKARQVSRKTIMSNSLIRTRTWAYQGVRDVRFSENLTCFVFLKYPFLDLAFCLITNEIGNYLVITYVLSLFLWLILNEWTSSMYFKGKNFRGILISRVFW